MSEVGSAATNVISQFQRLHSLAFVQSKPDKSYEFMSVSLERRCKRGGGYRIQAK